MGAGNVSIQDKYRIPVAAVNSQIGSGNICRPSCVNFDEVFRMATKKSLYEILEVPPHATYADIQASHQRLLQALEDKRDLLSREDYTLQMRLLKVAYSTLCAPTSRDAYDAHLTTRSDPVKSPSALLVTTPDATIRAQELRADAMLLRAEALSLRADAIGLKADFVGGHVGVETDSSAPTVAQRLGSYAKTALLTLGTLAALSMVLKVVFMYQANQSPEAVSGPRSLAEEKVYLQEYYQTYGVRPASRAEAELMDAERRKSEDAKRAQAKLEEDKEKASRAEREFERDARSRGDQAAIELQYAEQRALVAKQDEERRKENEKRMHDEAERQRLEDEQAKWRRVLEKPSSN